MIPSYLLEWDLSPLEDRCDWKVLTDDQINDEDLIIYK